MYISAMYNVMYNVVCLQGSDMCICIRTGKNHMTEPSGEKADEPGSYE